MTTLMAVNFNLRSCSSEAWTYFLANVTDATGCLKKQGSSSLNTKNTGNPISISTIGRMKHQSVLIITPLDNPDHVEIVQLLCRYLKDWCGVDTTYFAFDEATGIGVSQNDPWKWCQVGNLEYVH